MKLTSKNLLDESTDRNIKQTSKHGQLDRQKLDVRKNLFKTLLPLSDAFFKCRNLTTEVTYAV